MTIARGRNVADVRAYAPGEVPVVSTGMRWSVCIQALPIVQVAIAEGDRIVLLGARLLRQFGVDRTLEVMNLVIDAGEAIGEESGWGARADGGSRP